jgi:hypothetical protein
MNARTAKLARKVGQIGRRHDTEAVAMVRKAVNDCPFLSRLRLAARIVAGRW